MSRVHRIASLLALTAPFAIAACVASHGEPSTDVEASIASVTLAEDCESAGAGRFGPPADCAEPDGCHFCQQSGVQIAIDAGEGDAPVPFEVVAVELRAMDGTVLDTLDARAAQVFVGDTYVHWDQSVAPHSTLRVRFDTSAPDWSAIGGGDPRSTYGMSFRYVVVVRIDGVERTLELAPVSREAEIVT